MRYTRTLPGDMYLASTAVMITELVKAIVSVTVLFGQSGNFVDLFKLLFSITIGQPLDAAKMLVPACIYTVQNNLLYIAVSNLDAATYQVIFFFLFNVKSNNNVLCVWNIEFKFVKISTLYFMCEP